MTCPARIQVPDPDCRQAFVAIKKCIEELQELVDDIVGGTAGLPTFESSYTFFLDNTGVAF